MLLPPGQVLHKDLSTSFTNFENLLLELRESRFSGYLRLNFWGYEGILILDVGRIIQGYSTEKESYLLGYPAVHRILRKAEDQDGSIDVHSLSNEVSITLASVVGSKLHTSFEKINGDRFHHLLDELRTEAVTGYLDIQLGNKKGLATIYLLEGIQQESVIMSTTGRIVAGELVYQKILEFSRIIHSAVKVFWNQEVEHIQENKVLVIPQITTPILEFWTQLMRVLCEQINRVLRKEDFFTIWQTARQECAQNYSFLDSVRGQLQWKNEKFAVKNIVPIDEFNSGMKNSLALAVANIPPRRRGKIKLSRISEAAEKELAELSKNNSLPDLSEVINEIFQDSI